MQLTDKHRAYWRKNVNLSLVLLAIWFVSTFVMGFFAIELDKIYFFDWPVSFYMAAQGSMIIYLVIIWFYAKTMNKLDREFGVAEGEE